MYIPTGRLSMRNEFFILFCSRQAPLQNPAKLFSSVGRYRSGGGSMGWSALLFLLDELPVERAKGFHLNMGKDFVPGEEDN